MKDPSLVFSTHARSLITAYTHVPIPTCRHNTYKVKDSKNTLKKGSGGKKEVLSHIRKLTPKNI